MLRLLRWLMTGDAHKHNYVIIKTIPVVDYTYTDTKIGEKYILQCTHCGKMKIFQTY